MPPNVTQTPHTPCCSECERFEQRLNAATDAIMETLHTPFIGKEEQSQQLDTALDLRYHLLETYLEHLDDHRQVTAA